MFSKKGTVKTKQVVGGKEQRALRQRLLCLFLGEDAVSKIQEEDGGQETAADLTEGCGNGSQQMAKMLAGLAERFIPKKGQFVIHKWQNAAGITANIILMNDVATVVEVPADAIDESAPRGLNLLVPTVFACLRMRYLLRELGSGGGGGGVAVAAYLPKVPVVVCTRPTASHLVDSSAHLMAPGVVACVTGSGGAPAATRLVVPRYTTVLIVSPSTSYPFAAGLSTESLEKGQDSGRAVTIILRYGDALWEAYAPAFEVYASVKDQIRQPDLVIPSGMKGRHFTPEESSPSGGGGAPQQATEGKEAAPPSNSETATVAQTNSEELTGAVPSGEALGEEGEWTQDRLESLFPTVDDAANFAICEATRRLKKADLPMPLSTFVGAFVAKLFPRGVNDVISQPIDFKKTQHKKASAFVQSLAKKPSGSASSSGTESEQQQQHLLVLVDKGQGNVELTSFNKSCSLFVQHKKKFRDYLVQVHEPLLEIESIDARDQGLSSESAGAIARSAAASQKIVSIDDVFRPRASLPPKLVELLLAKPQAGNDDDDALDDDEDDLFRPVRWKVIRDNLKRYVTEQRLLVIASQVPPTVEGGDTSPSAAAAGASSGIPLVAIDHVLMSLWPTNAKEVPERLSIKDLEKAFLDRGFCPMHYITVDASSSSSGLASSSSKRRTLHNGVPPLVQVRTEKRCGNKTITIVRNLEALDLNIQAVSQGWKHKFATSVELVNPRSTMANIKTGTKVPWEIHLHGSLATQVKAVMTSEMGVPATLIQ